MYRALALALLVIPALTPPNAPSLGWHVLAQFEAHPPRAKSSGSETEGVIYDIAFLNPDTLLLGGSDDHAAVYSVDGTRRWRSASFERDVQRVGVCKRGFAVEAHGGKVAVFRTAGSAWWKEAHTWRAGSGGAFGVTSTCDVLADDLNGKFRLFDGKEGKVKGTFDAPGEFDRRAVHVSGTQVVLSVPGVLQARNLAGDLERATMTWPTPRENHGGVLTQAWLLTDGRLLREYVGSSLAVVEILPATEGSAPEKTIELDVTGHGWLPAVPSMIAISPDGGTMAFFRRGLDLIIIDIATDRSQPLFDTAGVESDLVQAAFSPDSRRLAIAGHPHGHEVTVLERSREPSGS